ncbi:MAG: aspartate kinase, partial [Deltaproteobacteria bacterium]|nr:aspartate kinase [Deltaproteobacteria bacterium]
MGLVVQKYGGTSVGDVERIRNVARRVAQARLAGDDVVVVVSAMAGETNRLLELGRQAAGGDKTALPDPRELDALAATGEQVSVALLAIALTSMGVPATSLLGHQFRMETDSAFTRARIKSIDRTYIDRVLAKGHVAVVAGFQGVDPEGNITTLGRGGSDTSAVAVAAAMGANACEIYTDVDGVYTADPRICPNARKIERISYEEMIELASLGAKVLQIRSVEVAMKYGVPVHVRSSFSDAPGTWVVGEEKELESVIVSAVTADKNEAKLTMLDVPDRPGVVAQIFEPLANAGIVVDMIIQNVSPHSTTDVTFTVPTADLVRATEITKATGAALGTGELRIDESIVKVSIVGLGMRS